MPLTGKVKLSGEMVCILDVPNPASRFVRGDVVCPWCDREMTVVMAEVRVIHFRHLPNHHCADPYAENRDRETPEHVFGKVQLRKELIALYPKEKGFVVTVEHVLPEIMRRADVMVTHPNGWMKAFEIQLSAISHTILEERTRSYESAGISACWLLGKSALTSENTEWSTERFGKAYAINFEKQLREQPLSAEG